MAASALLRRLLGSNTLYVSAHAENKVLSLSSNSWSWITVPTARGIAVGPLIGVTGSEGTRCYHLDGSKSVTYHHENVQAHEAVFEGQKLLIAAADRSAIMSVSEHGLKEVWRVPGIDESDDNRAHVNGIALKDHKVAYVTVLGIDNKPAGWRPEAERRRGALINVQTNKIELQSLFMPHSPRWHAGAVWFINSGDGQLCSWKPGDTTFTVVATLTGFSRGLCFLDDTHAAVGVSQGRITAFPGLTTDPLAQPGIAIVDTQTGKQLEFESMDLQEIFDIQLGPASLHA